MIGTHNGTFHCDEALACALLRMTKQFAEAGKFSEGLLLLPTCFLDVVRTRDPATLDKCTIVVDVGGVYDPETLRFDHHQSKAVAFCVITVV